MIKAPRPSEKLQPADYFFMIGLPVIFIALIVFGMKTIIGPIPKPSAVQRIRDGEIKPGMSLREVQNLLGAPKEISQFPDGSTVLTYTRSTMDGELAVEVATVQLTPNNTVLTTQLSRQTPTPAANP